MSQKSGNGYQTAGYHDCFTKYEFSKDGDIIPLNASNKYTFEAVNWYYIRDDTPVSIYDRYTISSPGQPPSRYVRLHYYNIVGDGNPSKGDLIESVSSTDRSKYPDNGESDGYWYESTNSSQEIGSYIQDVTSTSSSAYPSNGVSGNYWYVKR